MARSGCFLELLRFGLLTDIEQQKSIFYLAFVAMVTFTLWSKLQRIAPAIGLGMQVTKISIAGQCIFPWLMATYRMQQQAHSRRTETLWH